MQTVRHENENAQNRNPGDTSFNLKQAKTAAGWLPWLLSIVAGGLQVVIFPKPGVTFLCWIALAPLLIALVQTGRTWEGRGWRALVRGFLLGYVSGAIFYAGSCYWVYHTLSVFGGLSPAEAAGVLILFCLYIGLIHGFFGGLLAFVASRRNWGRRGVVLIAPFLWVAMELVRTRVMGFPWELLGTVLVDNVPLSRIAGVTGVYGLSFEIILMNAALVGILFGRRERRVTMLAAGILIVGIVEAGSYLEPPPAIPTGTARLVQTNVQLNLNWTPELFEKTLADLARISVPHPGEGMPGDPLPDLVIWPESPAPFFANDNRFHRTLSSIAVDAHAYVLAGELGIVRGADLHSDDRSQMYNSAELVGPNGDWLARYDKIHLVPFGEYVPFQDLLSFAKKLTQEVGDFVPGSERMVLPVHSYRMGTFICYESIFPDEVRQLAKNGAGLLVNISNDGWFGDTGAPWQHLQMVRMRAIENHRWVLRSTNTGVSASIDPFGRVVQQAQRNVRAAPDMPYGVITDTTFYTRHGDWFAWACVIISVGALLLRPPFRTGTN